MVEWKECTLSELGMIVGGATPSTKVPENYENGVIPWITPKDLSQHKNRYISHGERNISERGLNSCSTRMMPKGTILFSSRAPIGYVAIATQSVCTNQGFKSIVPNNNVDSMFIYYLLKYKKDAIESLGSGTTFKEVSGNTMKNFVVTVPIKREVQSKIASVLGTLDDKIELNERINDNLLQQTLLLFQEYYVNNSTSSDILSLYDFAEYINGAAFKPKELGNIGLPVIKIAELKAGITDSTQYFSGDKDEKYIVNNKDILFSWSGNPETSIDVFVWTFGKGILNQHTFNVKSRFNCQWFTFLLLKYHKPIFTQIASNKQTTGLGHVTVGDLKRLTFPFDLNRIQNLEKLVSSKLELYFNNHMENQYLATMRDTLLPKLMSGVIDVSDIDL